MNPENRFIFGSFTATSTPPAFLRFKILHFLTLQFLDIRSPSHGRVGLPAHSLRPHPRPLGGAEQAAFVAVDVDGRGLDHQELPAGLSDQRHRALLQVEDGGRVPVLGGVDVALGGGGHHQVTVGQTHLDDSVSELQLLPGVVGHVPQRDGLPPRHGGLVVPPLDPLLYHVGEDDLTVAAGPGHLGPVRRPGDLVDAPRGRLVQAVTPPDLVAQTEGVEGAHGEVLPVRTEGEAGDGIVVEAGAVELAAEHVPDSVATLLPARHYPASAGAPVSAEDEALPAPPASPTLTRSWI